MRNRMIKTFEEYKLKIEIEDSTVNFHFGHEMDDDVQLGINKEPQAGDEVMVDLPLVKLNHVKEPAEEPDMGDEQSDKVEPLELPYSIQNLEDEEDAEDEDEEDAEDE